MTLIPEGKWEIRYYRPKWDRLYLVVIMLLIKSEIRTLLGVYSRKKKPRVNVSVNY